MIILHIEHPIRDFDTWKKAFESDPAGRERSGVRCYQILRPVDDPNYVMINLYFESAAAAENFLAAPPSAVAALIVAEGQEAASGGRYVGRRIGSYRVVRQIGRGGMARVFLAERADGEFAQEQEYEDVAADIQKILQGLPRDHAEGRPGWSRPQYRFSGTEQLDALFSSQMAAIRSSHPAEG